MSDYIQSQRMTEQVNHDNEAEEIAREEGTEQYGLDLEEMLNEFDIVFNNLPSVGRKWKMQSIYRRKLH